jgi:anion-transporting  ArsA/GET3 family ATPase
VNVDTLIRERSLLICVGPGGVGKTTTAAALAARAASLGRSSAVLTIDPARRLADALGLDGLTDAFSRVETPAGWAPMHAAMLETQASFDALIRRITSAPDEARAILENVAYRAFSRTLARSHAYVAMERLHDVTTNGGHDLVVLDTPPTRSALEILDAPGRLARFLDDRVVRLFLAAGRGGGRASASVVRTLAKLAGESTVEELLSFFSVLAHLREGFQARAEAMNARLRHPSTAFVLVGSAMPTALADARALADGLTERGVEIDLCLINQSYVPEPRDASRPVSHRAREGWARRWFANENEAREAAVESFFSSLARHPAVLHVPELEEDPRDVETLARLLTLGFDDARRR